MFVVKKILFYIILLFGLLGAFSAFTFFKNKPQEIPIPALSGTTTIEDIIQPFIANDRTKGLSVGTYQDGKIEFYNFGICSDKNRVAPSEKSIYEIGSITKTFTATVLAQMVAEGKVNYEDPIVKYF